jgi:cysteine sulfinate desulfinase/cysteine desulfurase-like protein
VLLAMGIPQELADCSIRYSFCPQNTVAEAQMVAETTAEIVKEIRRYNMGERQRNRR